jgi:hypothetical protein
MEWSDVQRETPAAVPMEREPVLTVQEERTTEYVLNTKAKIVSSSNKVS